MHRILLRPSAQKFLRKLRDKTLAARLVASNADTRAMIYRFV
jgi:hypothetical protein